MKDVLIRRLVSKEMVFKATAIQQKESMVECLNGQRHNDKESLVDDYQVPNFASKTDTLLESQARMETQDDQANGIFKDQLGQTNIALVESVNRSHKRGTDQN